MLYKSEDIFFTLSEQMGCDSDYNCSISRGSCEEGICVCSVQFAGENCKDTNKGFSAAFSGIFGVLFLVSLIQLIVCIQNEYHRMKHATIWAACRITTQKLLYLVVLIAALARVLYFSLMGVIPDKWLETMELAYHPFLITGMSLVVCYWSEAFFLEDVTADASRQACFLSKSRLAFSVFNLILYLMAIAQFVVIAIDASGLLHVDHWLNGAFQSFFAILLFIVYIVFMAVGVEIFFKVRGAFNYQSSEPRTSHEQPNGVNTREIIKSRTAILFQTPNLVGLCFTENEFKQFISSSTKQFVYLIIKRTNFVFHCCFFLTLKLRNLIPRVFCFVQINSHLYLLPSVNIHISDSYIMEEDINMKGELGTIESEPLSEIPTSSNTVRSYVWKHFRINPRNNLTGICEMVVSRGRDKNKLTNSNNQHHLRSRHGIFEKSGARTKQQRTIEDAFSTARPLAKSSARHMALTRAIAEMVVVDDLPLRVVDKVGFKRFLKVAEPRFCCPSRMEFSSKIIPDINNEVMEAVRKKIGNNQISITSDLWTSSQVRGYLGVTGLHPTKNELMREIANRIVNAADSSFITNRYI